MDRRAALRSMGFGFAAAAVGSAWMEECVGAGLTPTLRVSQDIPGPAEGVVRILYNENPLGCSPRASAALKELSTSTQYYGFREARMFIDRLRRYNGLPGLPNADSLSFQDSEPTGDYSLMLGVGSSELLKALAQATMGAGGTVIEPDPSYRAVGSAAMIVNPDCNVKRIPVDAMGNLDLKAMLSAVDDSTRLIVVTNPNNPTGGCVDVKALTSFVDSVPESVTILIDEAYIEYAENMDEISAIPLATSRPNVLVARTFSKLYGLAGLRLGYGIASNQLLEKITPYVLGMLGINSAVIAAASAALQDEEHAAKARQLAKNFRSVMQSELPKYGLKVYPGNAPFVWAQAAGDATVLVKKLATDGVLISSGERWERPDCVRISAATESQTAQLLSSLKRHA